MDVIGDTVARDRRSDDIAIRVEHRAGTYSYEKACPSAWKAGNLFTHYGVRTGTTVGVDAGSEPSPPPILAALGASLLGATVRFDPPADADFEALVVPADALSAYDPGPGTQLFAYGAVPDESGVAHFEREAWSENPVRPPEEIGAETAALTDGAETWSHETSLDAADRIVSEYGLDGDDDVALRDRLATPGAFVAGVLAPLVAGATVLLDRDRRGTVAVTSGDAPESSVVDPETVL